MTAGEISLTLPADSRFVATARVTTASIAAELEYSIDEIEDLRVGVNELVAVLVEWAEDHDVDSIDLVYRFGDDGSLDVEATAGDGDSADPEDALDVLTSQILAGVVDEFEITGGRGRISKRKSTAA